MKQLTKEQFDEYMLDWKNRDEKVRKWANIPDNKYYTVSIWPEKTSGQVRIVKNIHRVVSTNKISKSNQ